MSCRRRSSRAASLVAGVLAVAAVAAGCSHSSGVGPDATDRAKARAPAAAPSLRSAEMNALRAKSDVAPCPTLQATRSRPPISAGSRHATKTTGADGPRLPDVTLACLGRGPSVSLPALEGHATVLNIWAQWCSPCRKEAPLFQALHAKAGDKLLVVGVDYDDPRPDWALRLAGQLGLRYPQLVDPDKRLKAAFRLGLGVPATVFVAADGKVVHITHRVYQSGPDLARDVRTYLGVEA